MAELDTTPYNLVLSDIGRLVLLKEQCGDKYKETLSRCIAGLIVIKNIWLENNPWHPDAQFLPRHRFA
jgi:hypothetical protein